MIARFDLFIPHVMLSHVEQQAIELHKIATSENSNAFKKINPSLIIC